MLKFISSTTWGADALTLRIIRETIIRPVIEYGFQIYDTASSTCLTLLDKIQAGAARIIAGLRNSCPTNIAQFEADFIREGLMEKDARINDDFHT